MQNKNDIHIERQEAIMGARFDDLNFMHYMER